MKYILSIVFAFLIVITAVKADSIAFSEKASNSYCIAKVRSKNSEQVYKDLVYSTENDKLAGTSYSSVSILDFDLSNSPDLVDSWKAISDLPPTLRTLDNVKSVNAFEKVRPGSLQSIEDQVAILPADRHQAFLNGLGNVSNNDVLSASLTKSRMPDVSEIAAATDRIKSYRIDNNILVDKNFGYMEGNLSGGNIQNIPNDIVSSGSPVPVSERVFDAIDVGGWERYTDSEYKMLNQLARDLGAQPGVSYINSNITGSIKIVSERPYCASCQGVIQQFNQMFPNIEIKLIDGVR